jgi:hypothetical protein
LQGKNRERAILNLVYQQDEFHEIDSSECPDFCIRKNKQAPQFGVEVTEFYLSETDARVRNIPEYITEILEKGRYRHKDDKALLPVCTATLSREGEPGQQIEGIFRRLPPANEYADLVAQLIRDKSGKLSRYAAGLDHTNLIIFDTEHPLHRIEPTGIYGYFFTSDLIAALRATGFREVHFVTKLATQGWVYIPLKMGLLLSELYAFDHILVTHYADLCTEAAEELSLFAQYLLTRGIDGVCNRCPAGEYEIIWSGYGVLIGKDRKPVIRDYADYPTRQECRPVEFQSGPPFDDAGFEQRLDAFLQNHVLECELARKVKSDPATVWGYDPEGRDAI